MPFVSIQLNSNRPDQIARFFDSVETTADHPEDIEILLHIDTGDTVMEQAVEHEKARRRFSLRILQTDLVKGYATLWMPLNPLWEMTHPEAYFVINLSDEMLFETKGWDSLLKPYVGYYPDHIFRLRGSKYRFRNYTDYWENGFAPDSLAFYTRRWLELSGDWNPCLGPDSYQQCVSYYLFTSEPFSQTQFNRDIPLPEIRFSGEGAGIGLEGEARYRRTCINNRAWFVLMSHKMQLEAKRRAMRMKAHILAHIHGDDEVCEVVEQRFHHRFVVRNRKDKQVLATLPYTLSWLRVTLTNWTRAPFVFYYAGGGMERWRHLHFSMTIMVMTYIRGGSKMLHRLGNLRRKYHWFRGHLLARAGCHKRRFINFLLHQRDRFRLLEAHLAQASGIGMAVPRKEMELQSKFGSRIARFVKKSMLRFQRARHALPHAIRAPLLPLKNALTPPTLKVMGALQHVPDIHITLKVPQWLRACRKALRMIVFCPLLQAIRMVRKCGRFAISMARKTRQALRWRKPVPPVIFPVQVDTSALQLQHADDVKSVLFSIHTICNDAQQTLALAENLEATASAPERIELLVAVPSSKPEIKLALELQRRSRRLQLRIAEIPDALLSDTAAQVNVLLPITSRHAYFVALLPSGTRLHTKGWDSQMAGFIGYYPDHFFRLRCSEAFRFRNYTDPWECGFAAEPLAFYTRRWLELVGEWAPHDEPSVFQQCVSYYLYTSDAFCHRHLHRDIPLALITTETQDIQADVLAEDASAVEALRRNTRAWYKMMSHTMQQEARRRAMMVKAYILQFEHAVEHPEDAPLAVLNNATRQCILLHKAGGQLVEELPYGISRRKRRLTNRWRAPFMQYYAGGGRETLRHHPFLGIWMLMQAYPFHGRGALFFIDRLHRALRRRLLHVGQVWRMHGMLQGSVLILKAKFATPSTRLGA